MSVALFRSMLARRETDVDLVQRPHTYPVRDFAIAAGIVGGLVMVGGFIVAEIFRLSAFDLPMLLGGLVTGKVSSGTWLLGLFLHLMISGLIGAIYGAVFEVTGYSGRRVGMVLGVAHWSVVGLLMGLVPELRGTHLVPGFFGSGFGAFTIVNLFVMHVAFGGIVGILYERAENQAMISPREAPPATSPLADSEGQGRREFERYKDYKKAI